MSIVLLEMPEVKYCQTSRPNRCPYCPGEIFQRWGDSPKKIRDLRMQEVLVYRYRCCLCQRTFRHYPEGVSRASQSLRMMKLAAICWAFGMSYRNVGAILRVFGVRLGHMSVWRDVQGQAEQVRRSKTWGKVRVLGVDEPMCLGWELNNQFWWRLTWATGNRWLWDIWMKRILRRCKSFLDL